MDFGLTGIGGDIASSTSHYLIEFSPVILLMAGVALAIGVIERVISSFVDKNNDNDKLD
jgi:hypothetical protein